MASKAVAKNGPVFSSLPAASGILVQSLRVTTVCEFDLVAKQPRSSNRLELWIANKRKLTMMI
jgi:hypothetical protein